MKTKFYLLFFVGLVFALPHLHGQEQILFQETVAESYLVNYDRNPSGNALLTNPMIETLARGNQKSVYSTEYTFTYDIFSRISKKSKDNYEVSVSLKNPRLQGDVFYRGFDAAGPLLPAELNFSVYVVDNQGGTFKRQAFLSTPLTEYPAPLAVIQFKDTSNTMPFCKVQVREKLFFYRNVNTQQFSERTEFIDSYYAAGDLLDQASVDLGQIRPMDYDNIDTQNARLTEIEGLISSIEQQDHAGLLPLTNNNDVIQLTPKLQNVKDKAGLLRQRMNDTYAQLPALFVQRGLDFLGARNEQAAINDFNKALQLNPEFAPAHLELARIDFRKGNYAAVEKATKNILRNLAPDPLTRNGAASLATDLYNFYLDKGLVRNTNKEYSSALEQFEGALRICTDISEVTCGTELMNGMSEAKRGIYSRYLDQAKEQMDAGKLEEALASVQEAQKFRAANSQDIVDTMREKQLFDHVQGARYRKAIQTGKDMLALKKYRQALQLFDDAFAMGNEFNVVKDAELPTLRKQAAKPVILGMVEEGLLYVRNNKLDRAREMGAQVQEKMTAYDLAEDPDIKVKFEELKGKIFSQECTNAQNEYNGVLGEAMALREKQDFIAAEDRFKAAQAVITRNSACGINDSQTRSGLVEIADGAEYQRKMREIDSKVNRNLTTDAIQDLLNADHFFRTRNIDRYGLSHPSMFDYINGTGSKIMHLAGAKYFAGQKDPDSALELLRKLAGWGFPKGQMKFVSRDVGAQLAQREHELNPNGDFKSLAEKYVRGNKGLKHVKKGFIKQWKSL